VESRLQTFTASLTDVPIPAVFGLCLAGVSGTCRAFRERGWEDGHNFQRGNRIAQLQQTQGVSVRLSSTPLHTVHISALAKDKFLYLLYLWDQKEVLTTEKHFLFYGNLNLSFLLALSDFSKCSMLVFFRTREFYISMTEMFRLWKLVSATE